MALPFIHVQPAKGQASVRDRELQSAAIKSHAARASHNTKSKQSRGQSQRAVVPQETTQARLDELIRYRAQQRAYAHRVQVWHDRLWPMYEQLSLFANASYSRNLKVKSFMTEEFINFLSDDAMFHIGAAYLHHEHEYLTQPDERPSQVVLSHLTHGLRIIRERLSKGIIDNATLLAILFVPFCEDNTESVDQFQMHWQNLVFLLRLRMQRGGIECGPGGHFLNNVIEAWEPFGRIWLHLDIPLERHALREPITLPTNASDPALLPRGLQILLDQYLISAPACALAFNLIDLLGAEQIQPSEAELSYSYQHTWRLFEISPVQDDGEPSTELIVSQALQVYCIRLMGARGIAGIVPRSGRWHMTSAMQQCLKRRLGEEERALFWSWIVAIDIWRLPSGLLSNCGTALRDNQLDRFSWVTSNAMAVTILKDYFCDDRLIACYEELVMPKACAAAGTANAASD